MKIRYQVMIMIMVISIVPLFLVTLAYDRITKDIIYKNVEQYYQQSVDTSGIIIEKELSQIENGLKSILLNQIVRNQLLDFENKSNIEKIDVILDIRSIGETALIQNADISSVIFYIPDGDRVEVIGENKEEDAITAAFYAKFIKDYLKDYVPGTIQNPYWYYNRELASKRLFIIGEIIDYESNQSVGVAIFAVNLEFAFNWLDEMALTHEDNLIFTDASGNIMVNINPLEGDRSEEIYLEAGYQMNMGFDLQRYTPLSQMTSELNEVRKSSMSLMLILLIISVVMAFKFSERLSVKFNKLINMMSTVKEGNLMIPREDVPDNKDEVNQILRYFYLMVERLRVLIHENYVQEIENKEARLQALQYQINPHFLFNTLEAMHAMAELQGNGEIGEITNVLSDVFRYNMNKNGMKTSHLDDELKHIQNYLYIQNILNNGKIQYFEEVEKGLETVVIPRFILQPLIENCVIHGFDSTYGEGCIELKVSKSENDLLIYVSDDGDGMDEATEKALTKAMMQPIDESDSSYGIGLRNVHQRIRLAYGEHCGLGIKRLRKGLRLVIVLPLDYQGGQDERIGG